MNEIASSGQLRMSLLRWILVCVPAIVGIGSLMGILSNSGYDNGWFAALHQPAIMPPGWLFGVAWTILYTLIAIALAIVINARGAAGRGLAIGLFIVQLIANFAWSPLFFGAHKVSLALLLIGFILITAIATTVLFGRVRRAAALLMLPYLGWLCFATLLNFQFDQLNPDAETLAPPVASTNIHLGQGQ
jgi:tryptophan-rich sensory protein